MLIAAVIGFCILLFVVALLAPRISRYMERGGQKPLQAGQRAGATAPGRLGRLLQKPFSKSSRAVSKSGSSGRTLRSRLPF
jgi:hypothetical protein